MTDEQRRLYEQMLAMSKQEITDLDAQIEEELAKVKDRLAELQNSKKAARQMYDAACARLGVPNELDAEDEMDDDGDDDF